jgi:RNA polymerase sigma-70 factor (ECF subfamily)
MAAGYSVKPIRALSWPDAASADWALVQQCAVGNEEACTRLVGDHQRMVYQLALHLLGDPQEALDLSQEVFLRVFRTLPQFRGRSTLKTWIYRIVINQAANRRRWWRRRFRSQQVALEEHAQAHGELRETRRAADPDQVLQEREASRKVWAAVDELPFDQRAVIVLREIDGLSYDEIADSLGVAVGTVKSRLARARRGCVPHLRCLRESASLSVRQGATRSVCRRRTVRRRPPARVAPPGRVRELLAARRGDRRRGRVAPERRGRRAAAIQDGGSCLGCRRPRAG